MGKKGNCFTIKNKEKTDEYSADIIDQIKVVSPCSLSSSAVKLAMENNIDIVFTNKFGNPFGRIYPCKLGGTTLTRKKQAESYLSQKGFFIVKSLIIGKLRNQENLLKSLSKTRNGIFNTEIAQIENLFKHIDLINGKNIDEVRESLLGIEGQTASIYFSCISRIVTLDKRDHEAKDIFNISLNYGYGILYSEIERACIISGLDPYLGFFHTDRYGKPSLVLDMIEPFRQPIVDRAIINLFVQKQMDNSDLECVGEEIFLTKKGREKIIKMVLERLNLEILFNNKKMSFQSIILEKSRELVRFILEQSPDYKPFIYRG